MVTKRKGIAHILLLIFIVVLISLDCASAIIGKIGNGKMILDAEVGDVIERSVLVINDNNVSVNITVSASGELEKDVKIIDKNFILQPGGEKKAEFTIKIKKPGTTTTRINVQFSPMDSSKSGVGLSSQVIIHAFGKGELPEEEETDSENEETEDENQITGSIVKEEDSQSSKVFIMMGIMSLILLVVLVFLIGSLSKKKSNRENKTNEVNQADTNSKKKTKKEKVK